MGALATIQQATAIQVYQAGARAHARAVAPPDEPPRWRSFEEERNHAWTVWRATRPDAGYVAHRLAQELNGEDPGRRMRGQMIYAAQMARSAPLEGPVGSVSLLV
jgi:hypothetical protein